MRRVICLVLGCWLLAPQPRAEAQVQRMALAVGEYVARAGSEALVRAFCVDLGRPEPTPGTVFRHSYGNPDSTITPIWASAIHPPRPPPAESGSSWEGTVTARFAFDPKCQARSA